MKHLSQSFQSKSRFDEKYDPAEFFLLLASEKDA